MKRVLLLCLIVLMAACPVFVVYGTDARLMAMGNCRLVVEDEVTRISLYRYCGNPAGLVLDEKGHEVGLKYNYSASIAPGGSDTHTVHSACPLYATLAWDRIALNLTVPLNFDYRVFNNELNTSKDYTAALQYSHLIIPSLSAGIYGSYTLRSANANTSVYATDLNYGAGIGYLADLSSGKIGIGGTFGPATPRITAGYPTGEILPVLGTPAAEQSTVSSVTTDYYTRVHGVYSFEDLVYAGAKFTIISPSGTRQTLRQGAGSETELANTGGGENEYEIRLLYRYRDIDFLPLNFGFSYGRRSNSYVIASQGTTVNTPSLNSSGVGVGAAYHTERLIAAAEIHASNSTQVYSGILTTSSGTVFNAGGEFCVIPEVALRGGYSLAGTAVKTGSTTVNSSDSTISAGLGVRSGVFEGSLLFSVSCHNPDTAQTNSAIVTTTTAGLEARLLFN